MIITKPGLYEDVPNDVYHADPVEGGSLSSSGARKLIHPSCPAKYDYERRHPPASTDAFDFGHVAHRLVLGAGDTIARVDADSWRTKPAKEAKAAAYKANEVPILDRDYIRAEAMADAVHEHPTAGRLLAPDTGRAEVTLVWRDEGTGVMLRARLDWLPNWRTPDGTLVVVDYKTCESAEHDALARAMATFGYHQQGELYKDGAQAVLGGPVRLVFVCQEKAAPHVVTTYEPDLAAQRIAQARNRWAIETYAHCTATGEWPAYSDDIETLALPRWAELQQGEGIL